MKGKFIMKKIDLDKSWRVVEAPLFWDNSYLPAARKLLAQGYDCDLPADVRMPLIANGIIKDPVLALHYLDSKWIEKRSWWFFKKFQLESVEYDLIELVIEAIDTDSDIFINGQYVGSHCDVHYPYIRNINAYAIQGENEVAVRVTTGLEKINDMDVSEIAWAVGVDTSISKHIRGDHRHPFVRRAQYNVGMDWDPRITTCGITRNAYIHCYKKAIIRDLGIETVCINNPALLRFTLNVELLSVFETKSCDVTIEVTYNGIKCAEKRLEDILLLSGYNYIPADLEINDAQLWWPNGYGEQPLYDVCIAVTCEGENNVYPVFQYGIRKITLDTSTISGNDRWMTLIVNGVRIFCKGGDWIPPDALYARVTDDKYKILIGEAKEANFNMLRIWGGGMFEKDIFYNYCDQNGILLWHDFMFACSAYPDHHKWFQEEVRQEFEYQTKRLRNHACIGLWSGNNENHWLVYDWSKKNTDLQPTLENQFGLLTANYIAKEVILKNCPYIPYWGSSPYGGKEPNALELGDIHKWRDCMMNADIANRIEPKRYDFDVGKFVTEYGYVGSCCKKTMENYFDGEQIKRDSEIWMLHTNTYEKNTVLAGIKKHYNIDGASLNLDDYILYSGMVHLLMLSYSLEAIRFNLECSGGLFWMYNDTWGEIGWTIIDYYLRRKIAYYGVKRALAPVKISMRENNGNVLVQGLNDTAAQVDFIADYGYISFDGVVRKTKTIEITLPPHSREYLFTEALPQEDFLRGGIVLIPQNNVVSPELLRIHDMCQLIFSKSEVKITSDEQIEKDRIITVFSEKFAHGVYLDYENHCSDNYFDLLPGESKKIVIKNFGSGSIIVKSVR